MKLLRRDLVSLVPSRDCYPNKVKTTLRLTRTCQSFRRSWLKPSKSTRPRSLTKNPQMVKLIIINLRSTMIRKKRRKTLTTISILLRKRREMEEEAAVEAEVLEVPMKAPLVRDMNTKMERTEIQLSRSLRGKRVTILTSRRRSKSQRRLKLQLL